MTPEAGLESHHHHSFPPPFIWISQREILFFPSRFLFLFLNSNNHIYFVEFFIIIILMTPALYKPPG